MLFRVIILNIILSKDKVEIEEGLKDRALNLKNFDYL